MAWKTQSGKYKGNYPDGMGSYSYGENKVEIEMDRDISIDGQSYCVLMNIKGTCSYSHEAWGDSSEACVDEIFIMSVERYTGEKGKYGNYLTEPVYENKRYDKDMDAEFRKGLGEKVYDEVNRLADEREFDDDLWSAAEDN